MWETQKLRETEGKLHRKEQEMARGQKEVSVFKMRLHEMQENLEKGERILPQSLCERVTVSIDKTVISKKGTGFPFRFYVLAS